MDLRDRLADVRRRPRLYGLNTYGEFAAFVTGMDAATEWRFLKGFREWLAARSGFGASLAWQVVVVRIAYPGETEEFWDAASRGESDKAVAVLFDELQFFLEDREKRNSE
ncbi:hypothetical protein [Streptomyces sp. NPDC002156]